MSDQADTGLTTAETLEAFARFRSYVEHEDRLINERISRTLLMHGFLLASFVLLLQSRVEAAAKCLESARGCVADAAVNLPIQLSKVLSLSDAMLPVIALIGVLTTIAARRGVWAAKVASEAVEARWLAHVSSNPTVEQLKLPGLTGGGSDLIRTAGEKSSRWLLTFSLVMWLCIFVISVASAIVWNAELLAHLPSLRR